MNRHTIITFEALRGIGVLFLVGGIVLFLYVYSFKCRAEVAEGKVVQLIEYSYVKDGVTKQSFCPVLAYVPKGGVNAYFDTSAIHSSVPEYSIGEMIMIFYDRDHPETAVIGDKNVYLGSIVVAFVGLIFLMIGFVDYIISWG